MSGFSICINSTTSIVILKIDFTRFSWLIVLLKPHCFSNHCLLLTSKLLIASITAVVASVLSSVYHIFILLSLFVLSLKFASLIIMCE